MRISIIGTGYVGLVSGACFSKMGNHVICVDINAKKISNLKKGIIPIYEPGLEEIVIENYHKGVLYFTTDIKDALENSNICFIAVGTPQGENGSADLQYVLDVAQNIGKYMCHHMFVVDKSTVPVGTAEKVKSVIQNELDKRTSHLTFDVISNPEFLKEGAAIEDFLKPDRIIVGTDNEEAYRVMRELYEPFIHKNDRLILMDIKSAEMTKYAANAMLATKISFMNEIANICERVGADVNQVRNGLGSDSRIGYNFIYPGCGYGGSCLPKDVQALCNIAKNNSYIPKILNAVEEVNCEQKKTLANKVSNRFGSDLHGMIFAIWGLSFKPETDDMRDASAIVVINELTKRGAKVRAYDPKAIEEARTYYLKDNQNVEYVDSKYAALINADALVLITEWREFRSPDWDEIANKLKHKVIFDGRNQYNKEKLQSLGFEYFQIGVGI